jgi:hypothetical protein
MINMTSKELALLIGAALCSANALAKDRPDQRLKTVTSVFVSGNNQAAEGARQTLQNGKTCLTLATKAPEADAVLDVNAESQSQGGQIGGLGGRAWIVSGTVTLKSGDLVWSHSERFSDAPLMSGGKTAGSLLVRHLADDAACKSRGK